MVLEGFPDATAAWVLGDSMRADVAAAEAMGIPAILVRQQHTDAKRQSADLSGVQAIVPKEQ
ncbi:MAG: HAD hydrolase-like protein [Anaerolineae bacterium]|jgi:FMN phosphatase YigB (HAD superfamily)